MRELKNTAAGIRALKIQGASNIAKHATKSLANYGYKAKVRNRDDFFKKLYDAKKILEESRPTEPYMRNFLNYVMYKLRIQKTESVDELKEFLQHYSSEVLEKRKKGREMVSSIGARIIANNSLVFTHCHSSTVEIILKNAKELGKDFEVVCTETRPRYQGRITAKELVKAGIRTTMIVDSAAMNYIRKADIVLVGADSILSDGSAINKVGTRTIAFIANELTTPFHICTLSWKFNPKTLGGHLEQIEYRNPKEVWDRPPKGLVIKNPAFDIVERNMIDSYITELGVLPPSQILDALREKNPWMFDY